MSIHELGLDNASDRFLDACLGIMSWPEALAVFSEAAGSIGANLMPIRAQIPGTIRETDSIGGLVDFYFQQGIYKNCIRARGIPVLERRGIMVDRDCASEREYATDPYYQEFLRPFGLLWGAYVGFEIGDDLWACLLHRGLDQHPFTEVEQRSLLRLRNQLSVASSIGQKLSGIRFSGMREALDLADIACLFFDRQGKIVQLNSKAEAILKHGVKMRDGELTTDAPGRAFNLRKLVDEVLYGEIVANGRPSAVAIPRVDRRPLVIRIQRVNGSSQDVFPSIAAIGLISDPEAKSATGEIAIIRTLFGLTATEGKIAAGLGDGTELSQIADELRMSYQTARSHLKSIFSKMDVSRQGELVALMRKLSL